MKGKYYIKLNFLILRAKRLSKLLLRNEMIISLNLSDNKIGYEGNGGPFSLMQLKVIQEVITLVIFVIFSMVYFKNETFKWNHAVGFCFLVLAVYFIFKK